VFRDATEGFLAIGRYAIEERLPFTTQHEKLYMNYEGRSKQYFQNRTRCHFLSLASTFSFPVFWFRKCENCCKSMSSERHTISMSSKNKKKSDSFLKNISKTENDQRVPTFDKERSPVRNFSICSTRNIKLSQSSELKFMK